MKQKISNSTNQKANLEPRVQAKEEFQKKKRETIKQILQSNAKENIKEALLIIAEDFETFLYLKRKYKGRAFHEACKRELGVQFCTMQFIRTFDDLIRRAKAGRLFA